MKDKNRVCVICEFPPPPGGMSNQALMLCHYLERENFIVNRCKVNIQFPDAIHFLDCIVTKITVKLPVILFRILFNIIQSDIVHIVTTRGTYLYIIVFPSVFLGKFFRKRVIINYHAGFFLDFYKNSPLKILIKFFFHSADFVTTPLLFLTKEFAAIDVQITKVSNIINLDQFTFAGRNKFKPKFITTRHLRKLYGNDVVIKAFAVICKKYPQATLTMAGDGDQRSKLEQLARELGVYDKITFTGYLIKDELKKKYERANIFFNGSRGDNMPISILESFAHGLPVVSTNPMGIPYLVTDEKTGLLSNVNNHKGLAANAIRILEDPDLGIMLTNNGKNFLETLTWENVYPQLCKVYFDKI